MVIFSKSDKKRKTGLYCLGLNSPYYKIKAQKNLTRRLLIRPLYFVYVIVLLFDDALKMQATIGNERRTRNCSTAIRWNLQAGSGRRLDAITKLQYFHSIRYIIELPPEKSVMPASLNFSSAKATAYERSRA